MSQLTISTQEKRFPVAPDLYGLFFEDISHAGDGGLYPEMLRNRSFEDSLLPDGCITNDNGKTFTSPTGWIDEFNNGEGMNDWIASQKIAPTTIPAWYSENADMQLNKDNTLNDNRRVSLQVDFEENGKKAPKVHEENTFPCRFIRPNKNHSYLFRVTYYKNRINLEVFHVLTDGMGGINFLRELTYQYLRLTHPEIAKLKGDSLTQGTSLNREDSFVKNYKSSKPSGFNRQKAYLLKLEKVPDGEFGLIHGMMPVSQLKQVCHRYGVSINDYLVACFVWSVYQECFHGMPNDMPVRVAVPVNLRPYFDSVTTKNFFVMISAEFRPQNSSYTFEEVLKIVTDSINSQISKEHLEDLFSYSVSNQKNILMRPVPLFIKNLAMKAVYTQSALANTTTITNIGNIKVEPEWESIY